MRSSGFIVGKLRPEIAVSVGKRLSLEVRIQTLQEDGEGCFSYKENDWL